MDIWIDMKTKKKRKILLLSLFLFFLIICGVFFVSIHKSDTPSAIESQNQANEASDLDYLNSFAVSAVIVPHHDLVMDKRAAIFAELKGKIRPKTVILVSPNHFDTGDQDILSTEKEWTLSEGKIVADKSRIDSLITSEAVTLSDSAFVGEHGISNILSDIHTTFADAKIIPIMIKQNTARDKVELLNEQLVSVCGQDCLLVASIDCSHYQPAALAQIHDDYTIQALNNLDIDQAWKAEVDSNQSLALLVDWSKSQGTSKFYLAENTNSGLIAGARDAESTSYIFGWYEDGDQAMSISSRISFTIGGDAMFARNLNYTFPGNKILGAWENFGQRVFWGTDLSMLNLEGPISAVETPPVKTHSMNFNFPPRTVDALEWLHINAVSLANNHTLNNGESGFANTLKVLKAANITPIGKQAAFDKTSTATFQNGEAKISVITIESLEVDKNISTEIAAEKAKGAKVIVVPHWGTEYEPIHSSSQERLAHAWIDAGADIVVGGHPHVIQDAEIYKNKPIFYSLGNLLFDQDFSTETQRGLMISGEFVGNDLRLVLLPTKSVNYKPALLTGDEKTTFLTKMRGYLKMPLDDKNLGYDTIDLSNQ
jgi:poly-gamma-glutamate synthesis protein (capsule biosynthesis protein)